MSRSITSDRAAGCLTAERFIAGRGLVHRGALLKRWRWVGVFGEQLMACAAQIRIGPGRQSFWALYVPGGTPGPEHMRGRTRLVPRRGELVLREGTPDGARPGRLWISDHGVELELELREGPGFEARCPNGRAESWTRKQAGVPARGTLRIDGGAPRHVEAFAVIDDSAGWHKRVTEWRWSAGVGEAPDGTALAWNLVSGVNDPPRGSERAVWTGGEAREAGPVEFAADLSAVRGEDGSVLRFTPEAERSRRENLVLFSSDYRAPFGIFAGTLPGGIELSRGRGVMEWHRARW